MKLIKSTLLLVLTLVSYVIHVANYFKKNSLSFNFNLQAIRSLFREALEVTTSRTAMFMALLRGRRLSAFTFKTLGFLFSLLAQ